MLDLIYDALNDSISILPYLLISYVAIEYLEANASQKMEYVLTKAKRLGPVIGSIAGIVPQCGFSAAASNLYAKGIISLGSLIAVFLSTSDEMLPLFISHKMPLGSVIKILAVKALIALISGIFIDYIIKLSGKKAYYIDQKINSKKSADKESFIIEAIKHTLKVWGDIFLINVILNILLDLTNFSELNLFTKSSIGLLIIVCLAGLIPNCAASIAITELFFKGLISYGIMIGGLLVSCGLGLLLLVKETKDYKMCLKIVLILLFIGLFWGLLLDNTSIAI